MPKNRLIFYFLLYCLAEAVIMLIMIYQLHASKKEMDIRKKYIEKYSFYYYKCEDAHQALVELRNSLGQHNKLRRIAVKAVGKSYGRGLALVEPKRGLKYIEKRLNCMPANVLNSVVIELEGRALPRAGMHIFNTLMDCWIREVDYKRREAVRQLTIVFLTKEVLLAINAFFCVKNNTLECMYILIGVHLIGLILFLFLAMDNRYTPNLKWNARNLAYLEWMILVLCLCEKCSLKEAVVAACDYTPKSIRGQIKEIKTCILSEDTYEHGIKDKTIEASRSLKKFIEVIKVDWDKCQDEAVDRLLPLIEDFCKENHELTIAMIKSKSKSFSGSLNYGYQLVGSLGLMLNVIQLLTASIGSFM